MKFARWLFDVSWVIALAWLAISVVGERRIASKLRDAISECRTAEPGSVCDYARLASIRRYGVVEFRPAEQRILNAGDIPATNWSDVWVFVLLTPIVGAIPMAMVWLWYFFLRRLKEVGQAIRGNLKD